MRTTGYLWIVTLCCRQLCDRTDHGHDDNHDAGSDHDGPGARSCSPRPPQQFALKLRQWHPDRATSGQQATLMDRRELCVGAAGG